MTTPRWDYGFSEVMAAGIDVDREQQRVVEEGGLVLTFHPLLLWAERVYPRGGLAPKRHFVDQNDEDIVIPLLFEAEPWTATNIADIENSFGSDYAAACEVWPSYIGALKEPEFITMVVGPLYDTPDVTRVWDGFPVDGDDPGLRALELAFFDMFHATGITDLLEHYDHTAGSDWWPRSAGDDPDWDTVFAGYDDPDIPDWQSLYEDLRKRGLVEEGGEMGEVLPTKPVTDYLKPQGVGLYELWLDEVVYASRANRARAMRIMDEDHHPLIEEEGLISRWA